MANNLWKSNITTYGRGVQCAYANVDALHEVKRFKRFNIDYC